MIGGKSMLDQTVASNAATIYVTFDALVEERTGRPSLSQEAILGQLAARVQPDPRGDRLRLPAAGHHGPGRRGRVPDAARGPRRRRPRASSSRSPTRWSRDGNAQSGLTRAPDARFRAGVPQLYADVDRVKAKSLGVPLDAVFGTLQASLGSAYVNDFNKFGRTYQVRVQADQRFRLEPEDIRRLEVRNRQGQMVPLGTLADVEKRLGPQIIPRYNLYPVGVDQRRGRRRASARARPWS